MPAQPPSPAPSPQNNGAPQDFKKCVDAFLSDKAPSSQRVYLGSLKAIARLLDPKSDGLNFPWPTLRYEETTNIRMLLSKQLESKQIAPATINLHLSALRGVLESAWRLGLMSAEDYHRAADLKSVRYEALPSGRVVEVSEQQKLWDILLADESPIGARDAALFALLRTGARRSEVVNIMLANINWKTGAVAIVEGKGKKSRTTYIPISLLPVLRRWLDKRGKTPGPFLHPIRKGGNIQFGRALTPQSVLKIVDIRRSEAGLPEMSPHDWRRTFITELAEQGVDPTTSQRLAGHSDPRTHQRYDRRGEDSKQNAVQNLYAPSVKELA